MKLRTILWRLLLIKAGVTARRHRACLARIARLENELWPQIVMTRTWKSKREIEQELYYGPGAVWIVEDPTDITFYTPQNYHLIMNSAWGAALTTNQPKGEIA